MTDTVGQPVVLSPSPRHMRKRRFLGDVPYSQLPEPRRTVKPALSLRTAEPSEETPKTPAGPDAPSKATPVAPATPAVERRGPKKATLQQKRLIALVIVILISISIPLLVLTLMFAG